MKKLLLLLATGTLSITSITGTNQIWKTILNTNYNLSNKNNINIINGNIVKNFQDYPYMAAVCLNDGTSLYDGYQSGATFITQNLLLTAGHVVNEYSTDNIINPNSIRIAYGRLNLKTDNFNVFKVKKIYRIPSFVVKKNPYIIENDLAIIEIEPHPGIIVDTVQLYDKNNPSYITDVGQESRAIGWGVYTDDMKITPSPQLRYGDSTIKSPDDVINYLHNNCPESLWDMYKPDEYLGLKEIDGKNVNHGDSGGPLLSYDNELKKYIQIGVTSWAPYLNKGGFSAYTFFTNLTNLSYQNWINDVMNGKEG